MMMLMMMMMMMTCKGNLIFSHLTQTQTMAMIAMTMMMTTTRPTALADITIIAVSVHTRMTHDISAL